MDGGSLDTETGAVAAVGILNWGGRGQREKGEWFRERCSDGRREGEGQG